MDAQYMDKYNKIWIFRAVVCERSSIALKMIIPDMALVRLIRGECKTGVTFDMAKYPMNEANMNIFNKYI